MNLAIDIGNTRIKLGVFDGEQLIGQQTIENWDIDQVLTIAYNHSVQNIILSSVRKHNASAFARLSNQYYFVQLTEKTPIPIENRYQTPETLGKDRLAAIIGAYHLFPGQHCLVIDAGTCITYDLLDAEGVYLGGNIAPGIDMRLKAMHAFTSKLPEAGRSPLGELLGTTTLSALQNGGQWGALLEAQAFIEACEARFHPLQIIFTGGDAVFFEKNLKRKIFVNSNLVLIGLNKILMHNADLQI
jgi:type III pantothenate kinase